MQQPSEAVAHKATQAELRNILASPMVSDIIRGLRIESCAARLNRGEALQESVAECLDRIARMDEFDYLRIGEHGEAATKQTFEVGDLVSVTSRCFTGSNKPGGVGTVIEIDKSTGTYKVKYSLGGQEKGLAPHFLKLHVFEHEVVETISRRRSLGRSNTTSSSVSDMATPPHKGRANYTNVQESPAAGPPKTLTEIQDKLENGKYMHIHWKDRPDNNDVHPLPQTIDFTLLMSEFDNLCCQALKLHETAAFAISGGRRIDSDDDDECMHRGNPVYETQLIRQRGTELLVSAMRDQEKVLAASIAQDIKDAEAVCFGGRRVAMDPALVGLGKGKGKGKSRTEALRSGPRAGGDGGSGSKKPQTNAPYIDIDISSSPCEKIVGCKVKWDGWSGSNASKNKRQMIAPAALVRVLAKRTKMPVVQQGQLLLSLVAQLTEHEMIVEALQ